jgi:hypothetical protein
MSRNQHFASLKVFLAAALLAALMTTNASAVTTGNLLVDPAWDIPNPLNTYGAVYSGPLYGVWGQEAAAIVGAENSITPFSPNGMLRENLTALVASQTFQPVDVSAYALPISLGNVTVDFTALFNINSPIPGAIANVLLQFRDSSGAQVGGNLIGSSVGMGGLDSNTSTWQPLTITGGLVPPTTVRIHAEVAYANASLLQNAPGYVDNADLRLTIVPEPTSVALLVGGTSLCVVWAILRQRINASHS